MNFGFDYEVLSNQGSNEYDLEQEFNVNTEIRAIKYLCLIKEPTKILNSMTAYKALQYLINFSYKQPQSGFNTLQDELKRLFVDLFVDFLTRQLLNLDDLINKFEFATETKTVFKFKHNNQHNTALLHLEMRFDYLEQFLLALASFTRHSSEFTSILLQDRNSVRVLFQYLSNNLFLVRLREYSAEKKSRVRFDALKNIYELIIKVIFNLSCSYNKMRINGRPVSDKQSWYECHASQILRDLVPQLKEMLPDSQLYIYLTQINLYDADDEATNVILDPVYVEKLLLLIEVLASQIASKTVLRVRCLRQETMPIDASIEANDVSEGEIACLNDSNELTLIDFLSCLYNLAVSDQMKFELYENKGVKIHLRKIIINGNTIEKEYALKLLWQFSFDVSVSTSLKQDIALKESIRNLAEGAYSHRIKEYSDGILWLISNQNHDMSGGTQKDKITRWLQKKRVVENCDQEDDEQTRTYMENSPILNVSKNLMISYNQHSRDLCLMIKKELEQIGFSVWIDVEDISGSSLESMARAIESSECVLLCMTQKYKDSLYCRAEAEYVFQTKKPFVPLLMQQDFQPTGWLGIILGSKIYIDFTKFDFAECMRRLKKELVVIYDQVYNILLTNSKDVMTSSTTSSIISAPSPSIMNASWTEEIERGADRWAEENVNKWLDEKNFHSVIVDSVRPCDGKLLYSMYKMFESAPESFYASLNKNNAVNLRDLVYFSTELKQLFSTSF